MTDIHIFLIIVKTVSEMESEHCGKAILTRMINIQLALTWPELVPDEKRPFGGQESHGGAEQRKWSQEKEEVPCVALPGGMGFRPSVSRCSGNIRAKEGREVERQMLINLLIEIIYW